MNIPLTTYHLELETYLILYCKPTASRPQNLFAYPYHFVTPVKIIQVASYFNKHCLWLAANFGPPLNHDITYVNFTY
jgi:hypothetical protein